MPTTAIETCVQDPRFEREVAKELSFWWRGEGIDINHVITRFATLPGDRVFSGPFPLGGPHGIPFAFVHCTVSHERDAEFRRRYALAVRGALAARVPADRIFVSFYPTDPDDHFTPGRAAWTEQILESR